jgi:hypothetical protein
LQPLHPFHEIRLRRFQRQMVMIRHDHVAVHLPLFCSPPFCSPSVKFKDVDRRSVCIRHFNLNLSLQQALRLSAVLAHEQPVLMKYPG